MTTKDLSSDVEHCPSFNVLQLLAKLFFLPNTAPTFLALCGFNTLNNLPANIQQK